MDNNILLIAKNSKKKSPGKLLLLIVVILVIMVLGTAASYLIFPLHSVPGTHFSKRSFLTGNISPSGVNNSTNTKKIEKNVSDANDAICFTNSAVINVKNKLNVPIFSYKLSHYYCIKNTSQNSSFSYFDAKPNTGYTGAFLVTVDHNSVTTVQKAGYIQAKGAFQVTSGLDMSSDSKLGFSCTASLTLNEYLDGHFTVDEHDCN